MIESPAMLLLEHYPEMKPLFAFSIVGMMMLVVGLSLWLNKKSKKGGKKA